MKRKILFVGILVVTLSVLTGEMRIPVAAAAPGPQQDLEARINSLERRIAQAAEQRTQVRQSLRSLHRFAAETGEWLTKENRVLARIQEIENMKRSGAISIYERQQFEDELKTLREQLEIIRRLDGGREIDGFRYNSIAELQEGVKRQVGEQIRLNNEYNRLTQRIEELDRQRDPLIEQARDKDRFRLPMDKARLQILRENLDWMRSVVGNDGIWLTASLRPIENPDGSFSSATFLQLSRESVFARLTQEYLESLLATPGKKADSQELAEKIKNALKTSEEIKDALRHYAIPEAQREIEELERSIQKSEAGIPDIRGCWMIMVGPDNYPVIDVGVGPSGEYEAHILTVGRLDHFKRGDRLFSVKRISDTTYDGTEFSFDVTGGPVKVALRLVMAADGNSIQYRSDEILVLRRCR